MNVEQLMSRNVKTCTPNDTLELAARIMWENDCGIVPVVDEAGRVVAMLTDRDVCMAGYTQGLQYWQIPVAVAASKLVFSVRPTDSLQQAEELMRTQQVRRLAVTNERGQLVGVLSLGDLARRHPDDVSSDELARTLRGVSLTRPAAVQRPMVAGVSPA
ncbi:MAG TPA: CBS domain-containing protein [Polyangiaceae bacterium]|nr:CBS domain-containing protein [Polyangiaceae bacterium]